MKSLYYLLYLLIGYLSGSILYADLLPRLIKHVDIRECSVDHNPGTANAFMYAGIPIGILVICCELLKGALPVYAAARHLELNSLLFAPVMAAPALGHAFPLFHRKKGGKAIAVSFGALLGLYPLLTPALTLAVLYILFSLVITIRPHFFRSVVTFSTFSCLVLFNRLLPYSIMLGCFFLSLIVVYRHFAAYRGEHFRFEPIWRRRMGGD